MKPQLIQPQSDMPSEKTEAPIENPSHRKTYVYISVGLAFALAGTMSYKWFIGSLHHVTTDNAYIEANLYPVNSRIMGYVKDVSAGEDAVVRKGEILATLDDNDFNVEMSFKAAKLIKAEADFKRATILVKSRALSRADFEGAQAALIAAQADAHGTELKIKYTQVLSPADGTVGKRTVEPGQFVQPGQSLFVIVPQENLWIKANYKETQLSKIHVGQKVDIKVDSYPKLIFRGHVGGIFPSTGAKMSLLPPENATGNFTKIVQRIPIKINIDDDHDHLLRPGMSVQTTILTE
jgi:membrane fusion protein (multidrug efflux system)